MQLDKLIIQLKPRTVWQAVDLGCKMTLFWFKPLLFIWLILSLPIFLILLWFSPLLAILSIWFFKPYFERALLYYVSRAVFSEPVNIKSTISNWPAQLKNEWFSSLSWRRLSPSRSFNLAVIQLEQLTGKALSRRLDILHKTNQDLSGWWSFICFLWEWIIVFALFTFVRLMAPEGVAEFGFYELFFSSFWQIMCACTLYISFAFAAPFYLTSGFALYLNRRVELEAWDIELEFKKIKQRLAGKIANALTLFILGFGVLMPDPLYANQPQPVVPVEAIEQQQAEQKTVDDQLELTEPPIKQVVDLTDIDHKLEQVYRQPPFENIKTTHEIVWIGPDLKMDEFSGLELDWLKKLLESFSIYLEVGIWCLFITLVGFLLFYWRDQLFFWRNKTKKMTVDYEQIPDFINTAAMPLDSAQLNFKQQFELAMSGSNYRLAVALLIQLCLRNLVKNYSVSLSKSMTEAECLAAIKPKVNQDVFAYLERLFKVWINLAWAHQNANQNIILELYQQTQDYFYAPDSATLNSRTEFH
ncbi:hypothetical protein N7931_06455 [Catenovulum sp. 2E275]|uniref:hypothetical protein n=1 Tax=Catenovulum sp. 2E275 TaxID=2980497 RepID=UPI0021D1BEA3|nr:hypothetical protein [Catenovulum sp. 2E275]MCU4675272.1 hypothetical protein [Catenovulum sp. 2E275]